MEKLKYHTLKQIEEIYGKDCQPLYKEGVFEPFQVVDGGYGYYGVIMENYEDDTIQCHICGHWFAVVGSHSQKIHKLHAGQYREKYGFTKHVPLCHPSVSQVISALALDRFSGLSSKERKMKMKKNTEVLVNYNKKLTHKERSQRVKKSSKTAYFRNKHNTCEFQILNRLNKVAELLSEDCLSSQKVSEVDTGLPYLLRRRYGSWEAGLKHYGFSPLKINGTMWPQERMVKAIKEALKKSPRYFNSEWDKLKGVPGKTAIERRFNKPLQQVLEDFGGERGHQPEKLKNYWSGQSVSK